MKKVLTLLLTFIITVCLINLNNTHTKAKDNDQDITLYFINGNTGYSLYTDNPGTNEYSEGKGTNWFIDDNTKPELRLKNFIHNTIGKTGLFLGSDSTIIIEGNNSINVTGNIDNPYAAIVCNGSLSFKSVDGTNNHSLTLNADGGHDNGYYYGLNVTAAQDKKIEFESGKYKINSNGWRSLFSSGETNPLSIKDADIVIENGSNNVGWSGTYIKAYLNTDINLDFSINGKGSLIAKYNNTSPKTYSPITFEGYTNTSTLNDKYIILGDTNYNGTNPQPASLVTDTGKTNIKVGNDLARYVKITKKEKPAPDPSPSEPVVKDESCEKVIGPTWHWNNTKGICEDYGVVGTAAR